MRFRKVIALFAVIFLSTFVLQPWQTPQNTLAADEDGNPAVLTRSYSVNRNGTNIQELKLNTGNVNSGSFGKLYSRNVQGQIYAQPLYVPNLEIPNKGVRNVVIVATMHNEVYAFDADNADESPPLWQRNLGPSAPLRDPQIGEEGGIPFLDINTEIGIIGTPVIDPVTSTIYLVAFVKPAANDYRHYLFALDIHTGENRPKSPQQIAAVSPGYGTNNSGKGEVVFESKLHNQRPALTLWKGVVYVTFASYSDAGPYHGWILGYDAANLGQVMVWCATPDGDDGGIWMSAQGLSVDDVSGDLFFVTGNGRLTAQTGGRDYGNAIVRLKPTPGKPQVVTWFAPYNYEDLNLRDQDLGSTGAILIPAANLVLAGAKEGKFYLVDTRNMGGFNAGADSQIVQSFRPSAGRHIHGSPVFWFSPDGPSIYIWSENDYLRAFRFDYASRKVNTTPFAVSSIKVPNGMPGGILSLSSNGSRAGTGILWALHPATGDANQATRPGILRAFDAANPTNELWNSLEVPERDDFGNLAKFNPAVVANGKVFIPTFSNQLVVYGLLPGAGSDVSPRFGKPGKR